MIGKVVINELAMETLLSTREGPVGVEIERRAQNVVAIARDEVAAVMHRDPRWADLVDYEMEFEVVAVIGFRDIGQPYENRPPTYNYLANKEIREGRFLEHALWIGHDS